jgi:hypothetical protein
MDDMAEAPEACRLSWTSCLNRQYPGLSGYVADLPVEQGAVDGAQREWAPNVFFTFSSFCCHHGVA